MDDIHEDENDVYQSMNWTLIPDRQVEIRENLAQVAAFILYLLGFTRNIDPYRFTLQFQETIYIPYSYLLHPF
jgi:hypothetical protein